MSLLIISADPILTRTRTRLYRCVCSEKLRPWRAEEELSEEGTIRKRMILHRPFGLQPGRVVLHQTDLLNHQHGQELH